MIEGGTYEKSMLGRRVFDIADRVRRSSGEWLTRWSARCWGSGWQLRVAFEAPEGPSGAGLQGREN